MPLAKFKCGHVRRPNTTDPRGRCRICIVANARKMQGKSPNGVKHTDRKARLNGRQKWLDRYNCGHPRTPENTTSGPRPQCKICRQAKVRLDYQFRCGHPTTPANTIVLGTTRTYRRCRLCATGHRAPNPSPILQAFRARDFAPRPLPVVDISGRSYALFPPKQRSA